MIQDLAHASSQDPTISFSNNAWKSSGLQYHRLGSTSSASSASKCDRWHYEQTVSTRINKWRICCHHSITARRRVLYLMAWYWCSTCIFREMMMDIISLQGARRSAMKVNRSASSLSSAALIAATSASREWDVAPFLFVEVASKGMRYTQTAGIQPLTISEKKKEKEKRKKEGCRCPYGGSHICMHVCDRSLRQVDSAQTNSHNRPGWNYSRLVTWTTQLQTSSALRLQHKVLDLGRIRCFYHMSYTS